MEALLKYVIKNINETISFLDKLKVDKRQKAEKDTVLSNLKQTLERCGRNLKVEDEENYDDVGVRSNLADNSTVDEVYTDVQGNYDDVSVLPGLPLPPTDDGDGIYDDTAEGTGELYDDVGQQKQIEPIACEKLTKRTIAEFLELKKDSIKNFLKSPWQKRWCVLQGSVLYLYETATDKQQKDAIDLAGYVFQVRDDITKESKRKERCFELKNKELQKTYEFCAPDKDNMSKWQAVLKSKTNRGSVSHSLPGSLSETYDDVGTGSTSQAYQVDSAKNKKKGISLPKRSKRPSKSPTKMVEAAEEENTYDDTAQDCGDIYEETGDGNYDDTSGPLRNRDYDDTGGPIRNRDYDDTGIQLSVPPVTDEGGDFYEEYEGEKKAHLPLPPTPVSKQRRTSTKDDLPPLPSSPKPVGFPTLPPREETGSGSGTLLKRRPPMPLPGEPLQSKRGLPPPPVLEETGRSTSPAFPPPITERSDDEFSVDSIEPFVEDNATEDYENMYQGMWDCEPDEDNELRFKRGEIIHIISREYHDYGWWIAESNTEEIGLVPVKYLMQAYDI